MSLLFEAIAKVVNPIALKYTLPKIHIDEWTFRIHYRATSLLLVLFAALLCMREYIGEHIKCTSMAEETLDAPNVPRNVLERYCFISTTFTVPYNSKSAILRLDPLTASMMGGPPYIPGRTEKVHHAYYQWVPFFLFFQALAFYAPHALWKSVENGKLENLIQDLNMKELSGDLAIRSQKLSLLARYIVKSRGRNVTWAVCFVFCEFLNLGVVAGNIYLTDLFLGKEFTTYGPSVLRFLEDDPENRLDPMAHVFPRVTKCIFHNFGPSGSVQRYDALCILALNILNEKIFTFMWFWFVIVAVITIVSCFHRLLTICSFRIRLSSLGVNGYPTNSQVVTVLEKLGTTDWVLLRLLRVNLDPVTFQKIIGKIYEEFF